MMLIGFEALKETLNSVVKASKTVCWRYQALATRRVFQFLISRNFSTSAASSITKAEEGLPTSAFQLQFRLPTSDFGFYFSQRYKSQSHKAIEQKTNIRKTQ